MTFLLVLGGLILIAVIFGVVRQRMAQRRDHKLVELGVRESKGPPSTNQ